MNSQRGQVSTFAIALLMVGLVIIFAPNCYATETEPIYNVTDAEEFDPDDLPWSNETDVIIFPSPPLPPFFSDFNITPTEIVLGDYLIISFVIENTNNQTINWLSTNRIGDITQIIEIELDNYESKIIWYRIIPHAAGEYDVRIDGMTGTFKVISTEIIITDPLEELNLKIDYLNTNLQDLTRIFDKWSNEFFLLQTAYNVDVDELNSTIDAMETTLETYSNEVNEQIESLENKISSIQTIILFAYIAIAVTVI